MSAAQTVDPRHLIETYYEQPGTLPANVRTAFEAELGRGQIQLYGMADLDDRMALARFWVALGPESVLVVREFPGGRLGDIRVVQRERIQSIRETPGLSCTVLTILGERGDEPLAVLRYTHRQRRALESIKFVLEQQVEGFTVPVEEDPDRVYSSTMAEPVADAQAAVNANRLAVVWRLVGYLKPYRRKLAFSFLAATGNTLLQLAPPFLTGYAIDHVVRPYQAGTLGHAEASQMAWTMIGTLVVVYCLMEFLQWIRLTLSAYLGDSVASDLRTELYAHLQKLSLSYFSKKQTGSLISRVSSDTDRLFDFVAFGILEVSLSLLKIVGLGCVLIYLDWKLGLLMLWPVPLLMFSIYRFGERIQQVFIRAWRKWSDMTAVLSDTIPGARVVKAFNQEKRETTRFEGKNADCLKELFAINDVWTSFWPKLILGLHAVVVMIWMAALPRMLNPADPSLTVGAFVSFVLYMTMFFQPIEIIGQTARMVNRATSSAHRIFEVLDTEPQITDVQDAIKLDPVKGHVTFENVSFAYDGVTQVIKTISFEAKPGEMIGLVGPSGAGKSTITNLIARFYEATGGRIMIDGVPLTKLDSGHYRRQIGMVLQDPYLFHGTIVDNIRYARPEASLDEVVEAARAANAHDFISKFSHGYDTMVGERGQTLSGGERQRVSIARAILANPRILILDEATSAVDTETERKIQEAMDRLIAGRTTFAIAHRLSTLTRATRLLVIEDGRITEEGTHAELLDKEGGTYRKLHNLQMEMQQTYAV